MYHTYGIIETYRSDIVLLYILLYNTIFYMVYLIYYLKNLAIKLY